MPTTCTGREPGRERARVVLDQDPEEALDRAEQGPVNHVRPLPAAVGGLVLDPEPARLLEVDLERGQLPAAADRVLDVHVDLGCVERALALGDDVRQAGLVQRVLQRGLGLVPVGDLADELLRPGRQLCLELGQAVVAEQADDEVEQAGQLVVQLLGGAEDVRVVLGEAARPGEAVHDAGLLVPVHRAELEQPQRQLAVGAAARMRRSGCASGSSSASGSTSRPRAPWAGTCPRRTTPGGLRSRTGSTW